MKRCPRCGETKVLDAFGADRSKRDGRMSHCRDCTNAARKARYYAKLDHEHQRNRDYYADHRAAAQERRRRYYREHRSELHDRRRSRPYDQERERVKYMKRHGGVDEWARMYEAQGGLCYLCTQPLGGQADIHVDHDHSCCPSSRSDTRSCRACRRGLAHAWCNQIIGLAGEDMDVLATIIVNFGRASAEAKTRIAARAQQDSLDFAAD